MTRDHHALVAFLEDREDWSFSYSGAASTHDCARFADAGVQAVFGVAPLSDFTSEWTTRRGARRVLRRHGGMSKAVSEVMTPIDLTQAARGDVGMLADEQLVLFEGETVVGVRSDRGLMRLPRAHAVRAWTVTTD